jgi:segregation and condensation protein B
MSESQKSPDQKMELIASIEALLFVAMEPVPPQQLAILLELSLPEVEELLGDLQQDFQRRGIRLQRHAGKVQLTSAPEKAGLIEIFLGLEISNKLSRAALETLAIIAYQQPVTRPYLDVIRGVNSDGVLRSLLNKGLIQEIGRSDGPGRPFLYGTTTEFLQYFGLNSLGELPALPKGGSELENKLEKESDG